MEPPASWGKLIGLMLGMLWLTEILWGVFGIIELGAFLWSCCFLIIFTLFGVVGTVVLIKKERERSRSSARASSRSLL